MSPQARQQGVDAGEHAIVDDALILESGDLCFAVGAGLVDLVLFSADEGFFVDVGVRFEVAVVGELEGVPFAVVDYHCFGERLGGLWVAEESEVLNREVEDRG